jgi:hypothetical protein
VTLPHMLHHLLLLTLRESSRRSLRMMHTSRRLLERSVSLWNLRGPPAAWCGWCAFPRSGSHGTKIKKCLHGFCDTKWLHYPRPGTCKCALSDFAPYRTKDGQCARWCVSAVISFKASCVTCRDRRSRGVGRLWRSHAFRTALQSNRGGPFQIFKVLPQTVPRGASRGWARSWRAPPWKVRAYGSVAPVRYTTLHRTSPTPRVVLRQGRGTARLPLRGAKQRLLIPPLPSRNPWVFGLPLHYHDPGLSPSRPPVTDFRQSWESSQRRAVEENWAVEWCLGPFANGRCSIATRGSTQMGGRDRGGGGRRGGGLTLSGLSRRGRGAHTCRVVGSAIQNASGNVMCNKEFEFVSSLWAFHVFLNTHEIIQGTIDNTGVFLPVRRHQKLDVRCCVFIIYSIINICR